MSNPNFNVRVGEEVYEARPDNARLYTFIGKTALADGRVFENSSANHIFMQREDLEPDEEELWRYIFLSPEATHQILGHMAMNGFACYLNLDEISEGDMEAYNTFAERMAQRESETIEDYMPDDWLEEKGE